MIINKNNITKDNIITKNMLNQKEDASRYLIGEMLIWISTLN